MLAPGFRGFSPCSADSSAVSLRLGWNIIAEGHGRKKLFTSWQPGSRDRQTGRGQGKIWLVKTCICDLLPPTRPLLKLGSLCSHHLSVASPAGDQSLNTWDLRRHSSLSSHNKIANWQRFQNVINGESFCHSNRKLWTNYICIHIKETL
jgi:hypothetical protein